MDYERIQKPLGFGQGGGGSGGGLSPAKLRNMLLGVEKKRKEQQQWLEHEEEDKKAVIESAVTFTSHNQAGSDPSDDCKDVDVVSVLPECSTSATADLMPTVMFGDRGSRDQSFLISRTRSQDVQSLDYESGHDTSSVPSSAFEFQKGERASQRVALAPFSKPAPSKWDDAQKWIASPTSNRTKTGAGVQGSRKTGGAISRQSSTKVVVEVPDQKAITFEEPDTKRVDNSQQKNETGVQKFVSSESDPYPLADAYGKDRLMIQSTVAEPAINLSQHDSYLAIHSATAFIPPPSTARSVSMRDMGTEMTPIASQEPSRSGTPVRATTPMRSPTSSRPSSPGRHHPASSPTNPPNNISDPNNELSEKELQMKTRREIMALGTQLGKISIAAWASKEEEDKDASTSLKTVASEQPTKSVIEARAAAWEEAEKAKHVARFKREEMKIQAWENHQKAKTEAELRKIEMEVERMRGHAQDRLMNKLAAVRHKAEEKRAAAEAKRNRQAARTEQQAEHIRRTGHVPSSFSLCSWCF